MFYIEKDNKIVLADEDKQKLISTLKFMPQYQDLPIKEVSNGYMIVDNELITLTEAENKEKQKEHERIQDLSMTRSDFFDGTIKAFGVGQDELQLAIEHVLADSSIDGTLQKVALNNYKNALNFYRKHDLFTILSGVTIPVGEESINITAEQWDRFFDETNRGNVEAWKELLPKEEDIEDELLDEYKEEFKTLDL